MKLRTRGNPWWRQPSNPEKTHGPGIWHTIIIIMRALTCSHYYDYAGLVGFSVAGCAARVAGKSVRSGGRQGVRRRNRRRSKWKDEKSVPRKKSVCNHETRSQANDRVYVNGSIARVSELTETQL